MGQSLSISCTCGNGVGQQLALAIREGDADLVQQMIDENSKLLNSGLLYERQTPLHVAASHGQHEVLAMLLERGANPNALNSRGQESLATLLRKTILLRTPLMLACKTGRWTGVEPLLEAGANILTFDNTLSRTCLHYACRGGHTECVRRILDAARRGPISHSWGFVRYVNVRDCRGMTSLHLASRMGHASVLRLLLDSGALVSVTTTTAGNGPGHGNSPIHYAARGGSLECIRELLAWGADRNQRDLTGYTPFGIAMKYNNPVCANILNPNSAEPLVWPSPWKFMSESELQPEAKTLLEAALAQANDERDQEIASQSSRAASSRASSRVRKRQTLGSILAVPESSSKSASSPGRAASKKSTVKANTKAAAAASPARRLQEAATIAPAAQTQSVVPHDPPSSVCLEDLINAGSQGVQEVCCICFEQFCTIEVMECGHQMCATCTLSLCCHSKPNPAIPFSPPPSCPFCRRHIGHLVLARPKPNIQEVKEKSKSRKSKRAGGSKHNSKSGSSGKGSSFSGSLFRLGSGGKRLGASGRIADTDCTDKRLGASGRISDTDCSKRDFRLQHTGQFAAAHRMVQHS